MRNINNYIQNPTHKKLAEMMDKAKTAEELEAVRQYQHQLQDAMTPEQLETFNTELVNDFRNMLSAVDEDIEDLRAEVLRSKLGDLPQTINWTYIASHYFGKSQSWLMQRINGNKVNGKEAHFNRSEVVMLESALHDLGKRLLSIAL